MPHEANPDECIPVKSFGINTISCKPILLERCNMFSGSSSDKLFALQWMQRMHIPSCGCGGIIYFKHRVDLEAQVYSSAVQI